MRSIITIFFALFTIILFAQNPNLNYNKFKQLHEEWPTPNIYRTAAGAPGHAYWQQKADYAIKIELDDKLQRISGEETITYHNLSPDPLTYLWLQLDQNMRAKDSDSHAISTSTIRDREYSGSLNRLFKNFDGGFKLEAVNTSEGHPLDYHIVKTMMRIDLKETLDPDAVVSFKIKWWYNINDRMKIGGRSGYEYFEEDDNYLYTIAQFFPRMCVYNEVDGWQNKQFLGSGEFTLPFGDYDVEITVPEDHLVAATGVLQNKEKVLTKTQLKRYKEAEKATVHPVIIATQAEAEARESERLKGKKTWHFKAEKVRDFAFASSRKFIWDAMAVKLENGNTSMAMSMYPKEGNPLWERFSTKAVAHTLKWYSHYTIEYPYPVAWSINADRIGMEYPMICFNFGRCEKDGTYSRRTKYGMIGVIIHEVGHNFFPMIVNSDERQWTWMDEGLNTFVQYLTEQQWERNYPARRGPAHTIVDYMKTDKDRLSPIMTNSESIWQFGNNAYAKPATGLNILRETIMGRELFDYAFKEYARRWAFKHPTPYDFFRTMEDASGVDLDWFWRGWFYTTDHCDMAISDIKWLKLDTKNPMRNNQDASGEERENISTIRNRDIEKTYDEIDTTIRDFYTSYDPLESTILDQEEYDRYYQSLNQNEKNLLMEGWNFYELSFENKGGLIMPVILQFQYEDGTDEIIRIPAEIWRKNNQTVSKVFPSKKIIKQIVLDPFLETADTDLTNNAFPQQSNLSRFELFKSRNFQRENEMQKANKMKKVKGT
jgi:hypothetical protein